MTVCSGWADLPQDVIQHLMLHLKTNEFYTLRLVSRKWASCSSQITLPPMVIPASQASLSVRIATLASWRQAGRFVDSDFTFQMDKRLSMLELRETTKALTQVQQPRCCSPVPSPTIVTCLQACGLQDCLTSCRILVELQYAPNLPNDPYIMLQQARQQLEDAHQTAQFAQQLLDENRVELRISMHRCSAVTTLPSPQVVEALKRFLHFDTYSITTEQPAASLPQHTRLHDYKDATCGLERVTALKDSSTEVCTALVYGTVNDHPFPFAYYYNDEVIAPIGTLRQLTKLHLSLTDEYHWFTAIDFEPLSRLTLLQDLALQCFDYPTLECQRVCASVCCQGVLTSNKHMLQFVTLTGPWTAATFDILQECSKLEILSININGMGVDQAQALAGISADSFRLTLYRQLEPDVLAAFKHSQPQIHMLTAWGWHQKETLRLPELESLQELTLVSFVPFTVLDGDCETDVGADAPEYLPVTGEAFVCFPMVTQLSFIDCRGISSKGLKHMVEKAMPALEILSIQAIMRPEWECLDNCAHTVRFDADSLCALCLGSNLRSVDLRGVSGLTAEALSQFKDALHGKRCQGDAPLPIALLLPDAACLNRAVFTLTTRLSLFLPNIFRTSDSVDAEQIVL